MHNTPPISAYKDFASPYKLPPKNIFHIFGAMCKEHY